jgi:hypothetical protein
VESEVHLRACKQLVNDLERYPFLRITLDSKALLQSLLYQSSIDCHSVLKELLEH